MDLLHITLALAVLLLAGGVLPLIQRMRRLQMRCQGLATTVDLLMDCSMTLGRSLEQRTERSDSSSQPRASASTDRPRMAVMAAADEVNSLNRSESGVDAAHPGAVPHADVTPPGEMASAAAPSGDAPRQGGHISHTESRLQARLAAR